MSLFGDWSDITKWVAGIVAAIISAALINSIFFVNKNVGIRLSADVSSGQPLNEKVLSQGPSDGKWPVTMEDVIGLCAEHPLPEGTRLTVENIGRCTP